MDQIDASAQRKAMVWRAATGGLYVGISGAAILYNSATHRPAIFVASGIIGVLGGCYLIASALFRSK